MRSQFVTTGWLLGSAVEISWLLLLLLLASPSDLANMFQYTDPGASWSDKMIRDVITVPNASGSTSRFVVEKSVRDFSSDFHPLMDDRTVSDFKTVDENQPCSDGSRGNDGPFFTVTLIFGRVLNVAPAALGRNSIFELSYSFLGPTNISVRCFPDLYNKDRKDDVCTVFDIRERPWLRSTSVEKKLRVKINSRHFRVAPNSSFFSAFDHAQTVDLSQAFGLNHSIDRESLNSETKHWILDCKKTDPRQHLLCDDGYFAYKKQHMILIDSGSSMGDLVKEEFNRAPGTSYLNLAQEIAAEYSKTLSPEEKVNVFSFNATGAHSLQSQKFRGAVVKSPLPTSIANVDISIGTERSNLSAAILEVIPAFQLDKSSLNVILVFSDGNFEPLSLYPNVLAALQVKVMLYILPRNSESDQNMTLSTNLPLLSEANGYFEMLDATSIVNPLYWIQGYFLFLSKHDSFLCKSESWSEMYFCIFKETMLYPALGNDGMLVEVEGIDEKHEAITNELQMFFKHYVNQEAFDIEFFQVVLRTHSCNHLIDHKFCKDYRNFSNFGLILDTRTPFQMSDHESLNGWSITPSNDKLRPLMKLSLKFILMLMVIGIVVTLIIRWIKQQNFVFFNYYRESSISIPHNELNLNDIDHMASIFYNNRDRNIQLLSPLGSPGSSGIVSRVMFYGAECAMKVFHPYARNDFKIEATTLIGLSHAHIVKFYGAFGDSSIVMELMDIDLFSFITNVRNHNNNNNYNLPLEVALKIMIQIAKGMSYLHQCGIAHQDLKSLNILLKLQGQVHNHCNFEVIAKVADFGNARAFDPSNPTGFIRFRRVNVGTRAWRAPELFHMERTLFARIFGMYPYVMLKPLDIYAFGIICHELLMGQLPTTPPPRLPLRFPGELVTLVEDCCHTNPLHRPEFDDICERLLELRSSLAFNE